MKIGDLVQYVPSCGSYLGGKIELGTITSISTMGDRDHRETQYHIVWHTADNSGWWSGQVLTLARTRDNESR